jgi:tRNA-Thr(GGU) m(6)t(6)A37 methyltransferase TsaA
LHEARDGGSGATEVLGVVAIEKVVGAGGDAQAGGFLKQPAFLHLGSRGASVPAGMLDVDQGTFPDSPARGANAVDRGRGSPFAGRVVMPGSDHVLRPIATLRTPFAEKFGVPRQSGLVPAAEGRVKFRPEFAAAEFTRGLEAFSHAWLITGFHENPPWTGSAVVRPPRLGGNERVGVFASRSPNRPNGLGLSLVRILEVTPGVVRVGGVDAVDGTPVYDLKPYLPWCEAQPGAEADWAQAAPVVRPAEAIELPREFEEKLGVETAALVRQVLRLDVQPAYQKAGAQTYGMTIAGWNVRWQLEADGVVRVCEVG